MLSHAAARPLQSPERPGAGNTMAEDVLVSLRTLTKIYQMGTVTVPALQGIDLDIRRGEYVAIMGPSGSGKSTILNMLGCLDRPTSGQYWLGEQDVSVLDDDELSEIRGQRIGFIFQSFNLISQLSVLQNIEVPLFYQGMSRHRLRVAIARAMANDPLILLADEPTGNLDSKTSLEIFELFDELHKRGRTLVMVTHDEGIAHRSQRVVRLMDGRIDSDTSN